MKSSILIILMALLCASTSFAEEEIVNRILKTEYHKPNLIIGKVCIEGQLFAYGAVYSASEGQGRFLSSTGGGFQLVQIYEEKNGKEVPKKCN